MCVRTELGALDHQLTQPLAAGVNELEWTVTVERPDLWYVALGDAVLHDVTVGVDLPAAGTPSDVRRLRTGLRSIRMRNWTCSVNGERLFLKGANQGPTRMALAEASPDELRGDVGLALDAGLDLLRVHAHVRAPSCTTPPTNGACCCGRTCRSSGATQRRAPPGGAPGTAAVDLLGHHPSIAMWCGHNEPMAIDTAAAASGDRRPCGGAPSDGPRQQLPTWNKTVLDAPIKRALEKADGTRPVVAHSGVAPHLPQLDGTDSHLYFGWYWGDERDLPGFARTLPRMVRFVSEFGAQAVPAADDSGDGAAFCEPQRWPDLDWARLRDRHNLQKARFDRYVPPADFASFDDWRIATQRYQAELIRRHVEVLRRLKYRPTGGFAQFCLADGHPGHVVGARPRAPPEARLRGPARVPAGGGHRRPPTGDGGPRGRTGARRARRLGPARGGRRRTRSRPAGVAGRLS